MMMVRGSLLNFLHTINRFTEKIIRLISTKYYDGNFTVRDVHEGFEEEYGKHVSVESIRRKFKDLVKEGLIEPVGTQKTLRGRRPMSYRSKLKYVSRRSIKKL